MSDLGATVAVEGQVFNRPDFPGLIPRTVGQIENRPHGPTTNAYGSSV